ncbi:uncharacterized protein LOC107270149 [Cephus cinctus]|uniref:Uncharacterized protein LOC107270149 n=1 Tax=Cephus cinctus TaxID=211228 RepID=A0AAJ7C2J9_CEPCN|nr:uncharacterized protein LOC107270149 [Cephus cinctus]
MEEVITDLYNILIHLEYPGVAETSLKDFEPVILYGSNRTKLLSWLISKNSEHLGVCLENLQDTALQDKLNEYYFEMGICNNKDELMGKSTNSAQLAFLKRLRIFMNNMVVTHLNISNPIGKKTVEQILNDLNKGTNIIPSSCNIRKNVEAVKAASYIEKVKKSLTEIEDLQILYDPESQFVAEEEIPNNECNNDAKDSLFTAAKQFLTGFEMPVSSTPSTAGEYSERYKKCMDHEIQNLYENFSSLNPILHSRTMLSNFMNIDLLDKINTPLTQVMEDTVIHIEEIHNLLSKGN